MSRPAAAYLLKAGARLAPPPHVGGAKFIKASYRTGASAQAYCPNQTCEVVRDAETNGPRGYTCIPVVGEVCPDNSTGTSRVSKPCGQTGGGTRRPIQP